MKKYMWYVMGGACALLMLFVAFSYYFKSHGLQEKPMAIVITSYNNKDWYQKNLDSVFSQNYHNYRVIYLDDVSPDGTGDLVKEYVRQKGQENRFTLIKNKERVGSLANHYRGIWLCDKDEIVVDLDGDDWFPHNDVLPYLNKVYADPDVWVTYGQFVRYPDNTIGFAHQIPEKIIENNAFRSHGGAFTHLRTFYAGLFQKIKTEDFMYKGKFATHAVDMGYVLPICEMAGKHIKFIPDVLYVYNRSNPINEDKVNARLQKETDEFMRSKEKYQPLKSKDEG
jgi:glycosyltransferase involved in cell wall biosynthesis